MKYIDDIELSFSLAGKEIEVKQINFRESICKPCQELFDKGYIDTTKPAIFDDNDNEAANNIHRRVISFSKTQAKQIVYKEFVLLELFNRKQLLIIFHIPLFFSKLL